MKVCTKCGERFSGEEINEWRQDGDAFSSSPFMCPDCYDNFQRKDLEDQAAELLNTEEVAV